MADIKIFTPTADRKVRNVVYRDLLDDDEKNTKEELQPYEETDPFSLDDMDLSEDDGEVELPVDPFQDDDVMDVFEFEGDPHRKMI
jgi:hypothetical protein